MTRKTTLKHIGLTMTRVAGALIAGALLTLSCKTDAAVPTTTPIGAFSPDSVLWKKRPIVIFGDFEKSRLFQEARERWDGFEERDIVFWMVNEEGAFRYEGALVELPKGSDAVLRNAFDDGVHPVSLVGKDGGVKRRAGFDVSSADLFRQIDSMPMRQDEMRNGK